MAKKGQVLKKYSPEFKLSVSLRRANARTEQFEVILIKMLKKDKRILLRYTTQG